ncbi:MAG: helix-turn-helix domain-containing protein [Rudaea sp.]
MDVGNTVTSETLRASAGLAPLAVTHTTSFDIDEQAASLREWSQIYEQISPGPFVGMLHELRFPGVQLFRESTSQAVHESGTPWRGSRAIGVPLRMEATPVFAGKAVAPGSIVSVGPDDEVDFYAPRGFEILGLVVDATALERHAAEVEHRDIGAAFAHRVFAPGAWRLDMFCRLLQSVLQSSDVNRVALQFQQSQRVLEQTMLAALVTLASPEAACTGATCASRRNVVDGAKAFMRAHIADPITVADICRQLRISRRTLQYSFQEVLGINPVRLLRAMRLNGARRDLRAGSRPRDTVQDIAARWGFWHLGHFVTDYKRMFGELPSEALGREPGAAVAEPRRASARERGSAYEAVAP